MIHSADEFRRLRNSDEPTEYGRAAHEEAPNAVWREIITRFPDLRRWVAHNKTVPIEILELLCTDEDPLVRATVAAKRKLPLRLQEHLAADPDEGVRERLAWNPSVTRAVLALLEQDRSPLVAAQARARLGGVEDLE